MKIRYENSMEDMIAFQKHLYTENAGLHRQKRLATVFMPVFLIVMIVLLYLLKGTSEILVWGGIFVLVYVFFIYRAYRSGFAKRVRQIYGDSKDFFCERQMEISEEGVTVKTAVSETRIIWPGIPKIVSDGDYIFIYTLGMVSAHVISRNGVREGNFDEFVAAAKTLWQEKKEALGSGL